MQRFSVVLLFLLVVCFAAATQAQAPALKPKPDPALQKLHGWVGHWTYEGEYKPGPLGPGGKFTGEYDGKMILGGFLLQARWTEKGPTGETRGLEIYGYDPVNKNFPSAVYMDNGSSLTGVMNISGNTFTFSGKFLAAGKLYEGRVTMINAEDWMSMTLKAEISTDGKAWTPFIESKYTKAKPAPKK